MKYKIDASHSTLLGLCSHCSARYLGLTRAAVLARLAEHEMNVHPETGWNTRQAAKHQQAKDKARAKKKTATSK